MSIVFSWTSTGALMFFLPEGGVPEGLWLRASDEHRL